MSEALGLQSALAEGYLRKGEYKQAEDACRRALDGAPGDHALRRFLVLSLIGQARWKVAIEEGKVLAGEQPEDPEACRILGECLLRGDKPGAARAVLRRAVRLDDQHRLGMALLARADIAVSSKPEKQGKYDKQEQALYEEFSWPVEELELSQATMTLDELDLEMLDEFPSSLADLPVAQVDIEGAAPAPGSLPPDDGPAPPNVGPTDSSEPIEISSSSLQPIDDDDAPMELTGSSFEALDDDEDLPMEITGSSIQAIEDLPPDKQPAGASSEIPEIEPDLAEDPDDLDDDEATREWDISLHPPLESGSPSGQPAKNLGGGPGPSVEIRPAPAAPTQPEPPPPAAPAAPAPAGPSSPLGGQMSSDTPRDGTPMAPHTRTTEPGHSLQGPWIRALVGVGLLVAFGVGVGVMLRSRGPDPERIDEVVRALQTGRDADYLRAAVLLKEMREGGGGAIVLALSALHAAAASHELLGPAEPARLALAAAEAEAPEAAETCAARGYLELRAGEVATARSTLVGCAERHSRDAWLRYLLGRALARFGDRVGAATQLDAALEYSPGLVGAMIAKAELHAAGRKFEDARAVLARVPVPDHPQALLVRARIALESGAPPSDVDAALSGLATHAGTLSVGRKAEASLLRSRRALASGELVKATKFLTNALRPVEGTNPIDHPRFLLEAAAVALEVWRTREASDLLDRAIQAGCKPVTTAVLQARLALDLDKPEEALRILQAAPVSDPRTHLLRARAHLATSHIPAARRSLLAAADRPDAAVVEALVSYREGRSDEAIGRLRTLAIGNAEATAALGRILTEEGRSEEAMKTLRQGLTRAQGDPRLLTALGRAQLREGQPGAALKSFASALESFPASAAARIGLAAARLGTGDTNGAGDAVAPLLRRDRPPADALLVDAELKLAEGEVTAARKSLGRAQAGGASGLQTDRVAGLVALAENRPTRAVQVLKAAAQEAPRNTALRLALATALLAARKAREARTVLKDVLRGDSEHPTARLLLGRALMEDEYDLEAIRELRRAAKAAKARDVSKKQRGEILSYLALAHYYYGEYGQALVLVDDAGSLAPGRAQTHLVRGMTFDKLGHADRATTEYEKAVKANSNLADAHFRYGTALLKQGGSRSTAMAIAHLRRYLALAPAGRYRANARQLLGKR